MKCDILILNKWLKMNKFKLNENKTKMMEINMNNSECNPHCKAQPPRI